MMKFFRVMWLFMALFAIGWAILPFILAGVLDLVWINWFGILTVPSGAMAIFAVVMQRKMTKDF